MVRKHGDMKTEVKHQLRGGKGCVDFTHVLESGDLHAKSRLFAELSIAPGSSIGVHEHLNEEEVYYILRGSGVLLQDGAEIPLAAGDVAVTQSGGTHSIENRGAETLVMLAAILLY
jgi:mannose-6-phosphate isomerase-like protein (cupin superfamily)